MTQRRIYQSEYPYFATWRTREGLRLFDEGKYAELLATIILNAGPMKQFDIVAYQIMPDHVHLLAWRNRLDSNRMASAGGDTRARRRGMKLSSPAQVSAPALASVTAPTTISDFMYTVKSFFINEVRRRYGIEYSIWQSRFYTRIVDTDRYFRTVILYIRYNPVKTDLPAHFRRMPYQYVAKPFYGV